MKIKLQFDPPGLLPQAFLMSLAAIMIYFSPAATLADEPRPLTHKLEISFDIPAHKLIGVSTITVPANIGEEINVGNLDISKISITTGDQQKEKNLTPDNGSIKISPAQLSQKVIISYSITVPQEGYQPNLINEKGISLTGIWHPVIGEKTLFELVAQIPSEFEAVSEADSTIITSAGNSKQVRFNFPYPLQYRHFVAGPYVVNKYTFGDRQELYTYFFKEDTELAAGYMEKTLGYLARYEKLIGPYPYKRFAVVENRRPTGYAMPTFTLLGQAVVRLPFITDTSLGHEVLHSWFGNSIDTVAGKGNWAEGLTTYLADQTYAAEANKGAEFRKNQLIKYQSYVTADKAVPLKYFMGADTHLQGGNEAIRAIGYGKACMLFHMLKGMVGEDLFHKTLQAFYAVHQHKQADWKDIEDSFEKVSGRNLSVFFKEWLTRTDIPELEIKEINLEEIDGHPELSFRLVQKTEKPYELDLPLTIIDSHGRTDKSIKINKKETKVKMPLYRLPWKLIVDENYDIMRKLTSPENPPVWSGFVGAAKKIAVISKATDEKDRFAPPLDLVKGLGAKVMEADKVKDTDLESASVIFLGTDTAIARSLFARPPYPDFGCIIDVRRNPLNPEQVAVLVAAEDAEEVSSALAKIRHYGKYSYLHFMTGEILEKRIKPSAMGQSYKLDTPPQGIKTDNTISFKSIIDDLARKKVIYVGENHTRYQDHILQLRIIRALYDRDRHLAIGMEMFTRPQQQVLFEYLNNDFNEQKFLKKSKYYETWGYDYRLYRDIINFAKKNKIPIIALNIEKDTVSKIYKEGGLSALTPEESAKLPRDRDLTIDSYRDRISTVFNLHGPIADHKKAKLNDFFQAQAIWDETMAESVADYLRKNPDHKMVVIAGQGHAIKSSGIPPRVARRLPVKQAVVLNGEDQGIDPQTADFLLFPPARELPGIPMLGIIMEKTEAGVTIIRLSPHGKAFTSGIKENDIILAMDGAPVKDLEDVKIAMLYKKKGDKIKIRIKRRRPIFGEKIMEVEVGL